METVFNVPQGNFKLQRLPYRKNEKLRAWDAADDYLLSYLAESPLLLTEDNQVLVLNDRFGALAVALHNHKITAISDSYLSQQATLLNLSQNGLDQDSVELRQSLDWPTEPVDLILIKIPKTLALLEDQLIRLQPLLKQHTQVIAAGMVKAMPASAWKLMTRYLGETKPSLAKKKARLIFTELSKKRTAFINPYPVIYPLENSHYKITNHANVFSRDSLDIGTRFLLQHLPSHSAASNIVDLGCGNGVVGLMLASSHPSSTLHFVDESYMAVASAKTNFQQAFVDRNAYFLVSNGLEDFTEQSMDLIVCNPPFHQQNTVGNQMAISLFKHAYKTLKAQGEFWVIGNRHLGYHLDLKRLFGNCQEISSNKKFIIWRMIK